jgi:CcmD family protein
MKRFLSVLAMLVATLQGFAQQENEVEMATDLRSSGKIYVVVIVVCVIFIGLILYLFSIDRRLKKIENRD